MYSSTIRSLLDNDTVMEKVRSRENPYEIARYISDAGYVNLKHLELFWGVNNQSWLYVPFNFLSDWFDSPGEEEFFGWLNKSDQYCRYLDWNQVPKNQVDIRDYLIDHPLVPLDLSKDKYLIVTTRALKKMLIRIGSKKADEIYEYICEAEKLYMMMNVLIHKSILKKQDDIIARLEREVGTFHPYR